jgi:hypothetical protein
MTASVQLMKKITGRESQGICHQDELFGCKPPVVKCNSDSEKGDSFFPELLAFCGSGLYSVELQDD